MGDRQDHADHQETVASQDGGPRPQLAELGRALRDKRKSKQLSIEQLAERADVSRSAISKIERGEVAPSTVVLSKLSEALSTSLSDLLAQEDEQDVVVMRARSQPVLRDEETGFVRRVLTPILPGRDIDWVHGTMPVGFNTGTFKGHQRKTEEYVYVLSGRMSVFVGSERFALEAGDSIVFQATTGHAFQNDGDEPCNYFLVLDNRRR